MHKKQEHKKKDKFNIILSVIFLLGLCVVLYPSVSNYINQIDATHAVVSYDEAIQAMSDEERQSFFDEADKYNRQLDPASQTYINGSAVDPVYQSILDTDGEGMIGYITIKRIRVQIPIYHGTDEKLLQSSAGHEEGSSLPVGGESTHAVLAGHRGLPSARLFTDLDRLEIGDTFTITVLDRTLTYRIDQIKIVLPDETEDLDIVEGEDYVTLVTCTPYAVNTHRLLVRGVRTEGKDALQVTADAMQIEPEIAAVFIAVFLFIIIGIIWAVRVYLKRRNRKIR